MFPSSASPPPPLLSCTRPRIKYVHMRKLIKNWSVIIYLPKQFGRPQGNFVHESLIIILFPLLRTWQHMLIIVILRSSVLSQQIPFLCVESIIGNLLSFPRGDTNSADNGTNFHIQFIFDKKKKNGWMSMLFG